MDATLMFHAKNDSVTISPKSYRKWVVVALLWLGACLNYVDRLTIFAVFPVIRRELAVSDILLALLGSTFLWAYAASSPLGGFLGDRFNRKNVISCSLGVFSLVTFATGLAHSSTQLIALRILLGVSEALFLPAALAHIASFHSNSTRSTANAIALTGLPAGAGIGGIYGGYMADYHSWRTGFCLLGFVGLLLCLLFLFVLPSSPISSDNLRSSRGQDSFREPTLQKVAAVFRTPTAACVVFLGFSFSLTSWPLGSWGPTYLHERFAMSLTKAGASMALFTSAPALVGSLLSGWLADRWARRNPKARLKVQMIGLGLIAPTMAAFGVIFSVTVWDYDLVLYSIGRGVVEVSSMPIFSTVIPSSRWSTAYGLYNLAGTLAGSLGVLWVGVMKSSWGIGYSMSFLSILLFAGIAVMMIATSRFFVRDTHKNEELIRRQGLAVPTQSG